MDVPQQGNGADLEEVRSSPGGLVCVSRSLTMSPLVLFETPGRGSFEIPYSQDSISISHLFLEETR